jgi:PPOX class probable F420-dependent enzyme
MSLIPDSYRDLLDNPVYVVLTTVMPDGQPQSSVTWVDYDGEYVIINSARGRQKDKNIARNPKVTVITVDPTNPYRWMEVRGTVEEITEEGGIEGIEKLSRKYMNKPYYGEGGYRGGSPSQETRVVYKIRPTRVVLYPKRK